MTCSRVLAWRRKLTNSLVLQVPRDVLQGPEVVAGLVRRRDQQEEDVDRLAVERREVDALARERDGADEPVDGRVPGVRDGDALADAGRAELLAAEDGADDALEVLVGRAGRPRWRLRTISRIASSLPVAWRSTTIASRTTKSESFIRPSIVGPPAADRPRARPGPAVGSSRAIGLSVGATARRGRRSGVRRARGRSSGDSPDGVALVVLDLLLVAAELLLDLVDAGVHRRCGGRPFFAGDEVVLVLGRDEDLDVPGVLAVVDRHLDRHQAAEVLLAASRPSRAGNRAGFGRQAAVAGRDLDLHPSDSLPDPAARMRPAA